MKTLIINTNSVSDFNLLLELAKRLKLTTKVVEEKENRYNAETEKAIKEAREDKNMIKAKSVEELFKKLHA